MFERHKLQRFHTTFCPRRETGRRSCWTSSRRRRITRYLRRDSQGAASGTSLSSISSVTRVYFSIRFPQPCGTACAFFILPGCFLVSSDLKLPFRHSCPDRTGRTLSMRFLPLLASHVADIYSPRYTFTRVIHLSEKNEQTLHDITFPSVLLHRSSSPCRLPIFRIPRAHFSGRRQAFISKSIRRRDAASDSKRWSSQREYPYPLLDEA